jgi:hypothetical protein
VRLNMLSQMVETAEVEESTRSLGSSVSTTACQDALTRAPWQASSPQSEYHNSVTSVRAVGVSSSVSRTLTPSASRAGLAVNVGGAIPVRVMAVYARFDVGSLAGTSSSGDSTVSRHTRLVLPVSMLSRRLSVDDEPQDLDEGISIINFDTHEPEISSTLIVLLNLLRMIPA